MSIKQRIKTQIGSLMPSAVKKIYFAALWDELRLLKNAGYGFLDVQGSTKPYIEVDGVILIGENSSCFQQGFFGSIMNELKLPATHANVAIDFVVRYKHPHIAIAFDHIKYPNRSRRFFHPQHFNLAQECQSIPDKKKALLRKIFYPQEHWTIVDVGCYLGYGSLWASNLVKNGKVISVEAIERNYHIANANRSSNDKGNWVVLNAAIWSQAGEKVQMHETNKQGNAIDKNVVGESSQVEVLTTSIEKITQDVGSTVDLLSLTVNGAEVDAIRGMQGMESKDFPKRVLAPGWYPLDGMSRAKILEPYLLGMGYKVVRTSGDFIFAWLPELEAR